MQWSVPCSKRSGEMRKQFAQWAIPKALRAEHGVRDGDRFIFTITHLDYSEELPLQVTSGGELRVPASVAQVLRRQAQVAPSTSVIFRLRVDGLQEAREAFDREVATAQTLNNEVRRARLEKARREPRLRWVTALVFERNPDVVAEVLARAEGICERCRSPAPFRRLSDGSPYLEVHHRVQLAHGGDDTVANAEALCPNCHRRSHYGQLDA